jgi:hypothetical protein
MGVDPARDSDNFAIAVYKLDTIKYKLVYANSWSRKDWTKSTYDLRDIINVFNPVRIGIDAGGGGTTIKDNLCTPALLREGEQQIWLWNDEKEKEYKGLHILELVQFSNYNWRNEAHFSLQNDLYHRRIMFPKDTSARAISNSQNDKDPERILDEIYKSKIELNSIILSQTPMGLNHFDVPESRGKGKSSGGGIKKMRKDRFSAMLIGSYIARSFIGHSPILIKPTAPPIGDKVENLVDGDVQKDMYLPDDNLLDPLNDYETNVFSEF